MTTVTAKPDQAFSTLLETSEEDVKALFTNARAAAERLRKTTIDARLEGVKKLLEHIVRRREDIVEVITRETRKSRCAGIGSARCAG